MTIPQKAIRLYKSLKKNVRAEDLTKLEKAFNFACEKYKEDKNLNGEYIIVYVTRSSLLLTTMSNNIDLVISCIFRDILTYSNKKEISKLFGEELATLVENITKVSNIKYNSGKNKKNLALFYDIFKKSGNDIRIFLVKICLRVDYIHNFGILSEERKRIIANETLDIYVPLIKNFSLSKYFPNIEDICYKYIKPQEYSKIDKILSKKRDFLENKIKDLKKQIKKIARKNKISITIESRIKSIYSIHRKMEAKKIPLSGIYDLIALRVITNTKEEVYIFLGLIHSIFKSKENRIKDYISAPKPNGYQSIHTTVIDNEGYIFEVQIQTKEMYEFNVFGLASHNSYKGFTQKFNNFPEWMKQMYSKQKKNLFNNVLIDSFDVSIFTDRINCFTPTGERIELPKESTILDFAFKLHTNIGKRVIGAWVNGEYVENLVYILKNNDKVHLSLSNEEIEYPVKYISYLKTKTAKRHFRLALRNQSKSKITLLGQHLLNEKMELLGYKSFNKMPKLIQKKVLNTLNIEDNNDLYYKIGEGKIKIEKVLNIIYNLDNDNTKYKSIVGLKITFKNKSPDNINALFKVFHDLNINIVDIVYRGIHTSAEVNVKNLSLLRDLLIEISRMPNVMKVTRVMSSKLKTFIISLFLASIWIISSPIILIYIKKYYEISDFLYKGLFYINIFFLVSLIYFFKYIVKTTLPGLIKQNIFWLAMFLLNTFTLVSVIYEVIFIFEKVNSIFLFSFILLLYGLTTFEYLDSKNNNKLGKINE